MPIGELIATFHAVTSGNNCDVMYVIWNGTTHGYSDATEQVVLDAHSGELRSKIVFDYEMGTSYGVSIFATNCLESTLSSDGRRCTERESIRAEFD